MADQIIPIWPEGGPRTTWWRGDIYTGALGSNGRYVPKINDLVYDYEPELTYYKVIHVSDVGLSTLQLQDINQGAEGVSNEDILLGAGPGTLSESFRCNINTTKTPHPMALDGRLRMYSSTASYYKVFKGTNISDSGDVISVWYDNGGTVASENIPLEVVAQDQLNNIAIKSPKVGYAKGGLNDGEVVTAVFYDDVGGMLSTARLLVRNSNFVRSSSAEQRYVTGIRLKSPFLSVSDNKLLEYPVNVTIDTVHFKGIVSYSDGSSQEMNIDGQKFRLYGMDSFIATQPGQRFPVMLAYVLSANESTYLGVSATDGVITADYEVMTIEADGAYSVKLFGYPYWINAVQGYRMEYWLYNLERDERFYATPYVELAVNSAPFLPTQYGSTQQITVAVDLKRVNSRFNEYRHVQTLAVTLHRRGDILQTPNWTIGYEPGQNPPYGQTAVAKAQFINVNQWRMDISCDAGSLEDWLRDIFYDSKPLYIPTSEVRAPVPTHFKLIFKNREYEYSVSQWNQDLVLINDYTQGELLYIQFFRRTANDDLQLGMSALPVHIS